jgi:hypothetical protein
VELIKSEWNRCLSSKSGAEVGLRLRAEVQPKFEVEVVEL